MKINWWILQHKVLTLCVALGLACPAIAREKETITIGDALGAFEVVKVVRPDGQPPLWVMKTEVPWEIYDIFLLGRDLPESEHRLEIDAETRPTQPYWFSGEDFGHKGYPALAINYHGAQKFAAWLSQKTGQRFRLPSEDEWEHFCAGGGESGGELDAIAWYENNSASKTAPIGKKAPNGFGLYDTLGNVAEWAVGRDGKMVIKGGAFWDTAEDTHCAQREIYTSDWNMSDPQFPKSKWWMADAPFAGFRLVMEEEEGGENATWVSLFNGRDLDGWVVKFAGYPLGENFNDTFHVEDGALKVSYDAYERFNDEFGHIFYEQPFSNYRLRLEYRFTGEQVAGGKIWGRRNSGVMIHAQAPTSMLKEQKVPVSIEVQFLGGLGDGPRPTGNLCTPGTNVVIDGQLVKKHCTPSSSGTFDGDGWVTMEVEVRGSRLVRHMINGDVVFEYSAPQLDPEDPRAAPFLNDDGHLLSGGYIALQAESHPVEFRNIQILELGPE
jgi:hypothetical protein